jgi:hypothetical protein
MLQNAKNELIKGPEFRGTVMKTWTESWFRHKEKSLQGPNEEFYQLKRQSCLWCRVVRCRSVEHYFKCQFEMSCVSWRGETSLKMEPRDRSRGLHFDNFPGLNSWWVIGWLVNMPALSQSWDNTFTDPGKGITSGVTDMCLVFLIWFDIFTRIIVYWHKSMIYQFVPHGVLVCRQMVVVYLYKQNVESFYLGTYTQSGVV